MAEASRRLRLLSVVAPMLNEEGSVEELHRRLVAALGHLPLEIVLVDDGSTDRTPQLLAGMAARDPRVRVVHLSRAFGHQTALTAGLDHARGDAVVMMDADLQDPPEVIPALLERWRAGADVVIARRSAREGETRFKLATARAFYKLIGRLAQVPVEADAGDFRLLDRCALDALLEMRERSRFIRGMTSWVGFKQDVVDYDRDARHAGETKYPLRKMVKFAIDALSSFSHLPLQLATYLGLLCALLAFLCIPLAVVARYSDIYVPGISSLLVVVLGIGGVQLMTLGVIGEYIARIYDEVKRRPLYVVARRRNLPHADGTQDGEPPISAAEHERISTW
jgi:dolichol-phosphate mannosyltransferase